MTRILSEESSILLEKGMQIAPRVIGHQDRNELSPSFGYFGRRYWAWKTAAMPDSSNQYALYYLTLLWSVKDAGNPFFQSAKLLEWIQAGISRWIELQHADGSFDQVFPNEHSVGATSYTLHAILEAYKILDQCLDASLKDRLHDSIEMAGTFLLENDETYGIISNHLALYAVTFHELWKLTGRNAFRSKCESQIETILRHMSPEGWFKEYEGSDPGYMTQAIYYLARLLHGGYDVLNEPLSNSIREYMPYFIHPDGSIGGHYGSRNSTIFYPGGFALLSILYPEARKILACMCEGMRRGNTPTPDSLDFPNAVRLACNYLVSWDHLKNTRHLEEENDTYRLPHDLPRIWKEFPESGVIIAGNTSYYAITGTKKGGAMKIFDKRSRRLVCDDRGYIATYGSHSVTTQCHSETNYVLEENNITITHPLFLVSLQKMTPLKYLLILLLGLSVFRVRWIREEFKKRLVVLLITGKEKTTGWCKRKIRFGENEIFIVDEIAPPHDAPLRNVSRNLQFSAIHMASADYFDLSGLLLDKRNVIPVVDQNRVVVTKEFTFPAPNENK